MTYRHQDNWDITAYSDSDWGSDTMDRKSVLSVLLYVGKNLLDWSASKAGYSVALSSAEAEYYAMAEACKLILAFRNLLTEASRFASRTLFTPSPSVLLVDNEAARLFGMSVKTSKRLRHIDLKHFFVRDLVQDDVVTLVKVKTDFNRSDINTKVLGSQRFEYLVPLVTGEVDLPHPLKDSSSLPVKMGPAR